MAISKHRPLRTYDAQTIIDDLDAHGLQKILEVQIAQCGEEGLADTLYFEGMYDAIEILVSYDIERWPDFLEKAYEYLKERKLLMKI